jgi:SAM-dependent methyltransferase
VRSRAERYDWELRHVLGRSDEDLAHWLKLAARNGGPILELACGTGRVAAPLQAAGYDVTGLDLDLDMLAGARQRSVRKLVCADMRSFALRAEFGLVFVAYNSLQLLTDASDRLACLRCAIAHLRSGGLVAIEITDFQDGDVDPWVEPEHLGTADGVTLYGSLFHDTAARITRYNRRFEADGEVFEDAISLYSPRPGEIGQLLVAAGASAPTRTRQGNAQRWVASKP